ncbi:hypothetical protein H6763_01120 [Candidatus Nomurabacteria bacterium]|uniref:Uncharacterized protein n=1 Tax=Candidatus Dojkabacteria bacterium TaxID=2099670 RepID=A0A955KX32_9BACT|nr:hypothetical protein [Candidatus Dojkabacteria bacterium]MCB9790002.1 hypothetical protein [Candidatus Nomurabacteria bacterium]MCB9803410.1 hypothetical protein [Candidatus Nomurabacteria bacterium]
MQNGVKNGKATQFSSKQQPSPDQKSKGWERKRQSQIFMDRITDYMGMTISEFEEVKENMEHHKDQFTINDKLAFTYISKMSSSSKLLIDWVDRLLGKPKPENEQEMQITPDKFILEIIDKTDDVES